MGFLVYLKMPEFTNSRCVFNFNRVDCGFIFINLKIAEKPTNKPKIKNITLKIFNIFKSQLGNRQRV